VYSKNRLAVFGGFDPSFPHHQKSSSVFTKTLENYGVSLYWHSQGIETLLANGKRNPAAGIMVALLSEIARAEVETLRERIMSGLNEARKKGVKLGRPAGTKNSAVELLKKHQDIVRNLKNGQSVRNTGKITGKGFSTVQRVKAVWLQDQQPALAGV
jgi:DNA invertase Pin-like site-specific DNA recombinase